MRVIAGSARRIRLQAPAGHAVRPTGDRARERLFAVLQPWLENALCLDLFAGSGALGIEALSRGARHCVFVDRDARSRAAVRANLERTGLEERAELLALPAEAALARLSRGGARFDLVFLDPPYDAPELVAAALATLPALGLLAPQGLVTVERRRDAGPLPGGWEQGRSIVTGDSEIVLARPAPAAIDPRESTPPAC